MNVRIMAGVGMFLLAAGILAIFFLTDGHLSDLVQPETDGQFQLGVPPVAVTGEEGAAEAMGFLEEYNAGYRRLWTALQGAGWNAATDFKDENTAARLAAAAELAGYVGSRDVIERLRLLRGRLDLSELQDRQIEKAWQLAAHYPGTIPATVEKLLHAEAVLEDSLQNHTCRVALPGQPERAMTTGEMDHFLRESRDPAARLAVWEAGLEIGPRLRDGLVEAQTLRNAVAREMGYSSFFSLEVADYGMTSQEMTRLLDDVVAGIMPLYQQLHCWLKHELAARYGVEEVPRRIPAHWLGDRWGREWPGVIEGIDLDGMLRDVQPQWIIEQGERFYTGMGFEPLPLTFWGRSDLFPLPAEAGRRKKALPSAWHIDLDQDVRCNMSVQNDYHWFRATHHQLGRVYYFLAYSRDEVPPILRTGANRAFAGSMGSLIELAAGQVPYLQQVGMLAPDETPEQIRWLLTQALQGPVVLLPFACGTMSHWEHDLYETDLPRHQLNTRWWEYAGRYQGIAPPAERGEEFCDPATHAGIIENPARAYDQALGAVIVHQLHRYICGAILQQDVRAANYHGNKQVGLYLHSIMELGATRDWKTVMRQATGEDLSSTALLEYYDPLLAWLQQQNEGREVGF